MQEITLKIVGMHCTACAMNIDGELEDSPGIILAKTNYAKAETKVRFDAQQTDINKIKSIIKQAGYDTR